MLKWNEVRPTLNKGRPESYELNELPAVSDIIHLTLNVIFPSRLRYFRVCVHPAKRNEYASLEFNTLNNYTKRHSQLAELIAEIIQPHRVHSKVEMPILSFQTKSNSHLTAHQFVHSCVRITHHCEIIGRDSQKIISEMKNLSDHYRAIKND